MKKKNLCWQKIVRTVGLFSILTSGYFWNEKTTAQNITTTPTYLDLPDGFGNSEEDEYEPEIIEFYGDTFEGDAFYFCLDRSSSMGHTTDSGEIKFSVLKREVNRSLQGLTNRSLASVVFYNKEIQPLVYGDPPIKMDSPGKAGLMAKVSSTPISNGSCLVYGAEKALEIARKTTKEYETMIVVGDGMTHCNVGENDPTRVYQRIVAKNAERIPINTIYTGPQHGEEWDIGKTNLENLARATNGKFKIAR